MTSVEYNLNGLNIQHPDFMSQKHHILNEGSISQGVPNANKQRLFLVMADAHSFEDQVLVYSTPATSPAAQAPSVKQQPGRPSLEAPH